jgi:hypothetical protein
MSTSSLQERGDQIAGYICVQFDGCDADSFEGEPFQRVNNIADSEIAVELEDAIIGRGLVAVVLQQAARRCRWRFGLGRWARSRFARKRDWSTRARRNEIIREKTSDCSTRHDVLRDRRRCSTF